MWHAAWQNLERSRSRNWGRDLPRLPIERARSMPVSCRSSTSLAADRVDPIHASGCRSTAVLNGAGSIHADGCRATAYATQSAGSCFSCYAVHVGCLRRTGGSPNMMSRGNRAARQRSSKAAKAAESSRAKQAAEAAKARTGRARCRTRRPSISIIGVLLGRPPRFTGLLCLLFEKNFLICFDVRIPNAAHARSCSSDGCGSSGFASHL